MRLKVRIPNVEPGLYEMPTECPWRGCDGTAFKPHQDKCPKAVRDFRHAQVETRRYRCLRCRHTFRVYPRGVSRADQADGLKAFSALLYLLGLSYGAVSDALEALAIVLAKPLYLGKSSVYRNVQALGRTARRLRRAWLGAGGRIPVIGTDVTRVQCRGQSLPVGVVVDGLNGIELTIDILDDETAETQLRWLREIAEMVGAEVLVSDDADGLKIVADELALDHQVCRAHVTKNTLRLVGELAIQGLQAPDPVPQGVDKSLEQFIADLETVQWLVATHPCDGQEQLDALHTDYCQAPAPREGQKATMWYRMRLLTLDLWNDWSRLTLYQRWKGPDEERLDGPNNASERGIGWWVKERYRPMRGYKRPRSATNVSSLLGWLDSQPAGYNLAELTAD